MQVVMGVLVPVLTAAMSYVAWSVKRIAEKVDDLSVGHAASAERVHVIREGWPLVQTRIGILESKVEKNSYRLDELDKDLGPRR